MEMWRRLTASRAAWAAAAVAVLLLVGFAAWIVGSAGGSPDRGSRQGKHPPGMQRPESHGSGSAVTAGATLRRAEPQRVGGAAPSGALPAPTMAPVPPAPLRQPSPMRRGGSRAGGDS